jgi:hypothetical protein
VPPLVPRDPGPSIPQDPDHADNFRSEKVSVRLRPPELEFIDSIGKRLNMQRSEVIRWVLNSWRYVSTEVIDLSKLEPLPDRYKVEPPAKRSR